MNRFFVTKEPDGTGYYISVQITIYREFLGRYPEWLKSYDNSNIGYTTTFEYLVNNLIHLQESEAKQLCREMTEVYDEKLRICENTGNWVNSPFDFSKMELLHSK